MTDAEAIAFLRSITLHTTRVRVRIGRSVVEGSVVECGEYLSGPGLRVADVPCWFYLTDRARDIATVEVISAPGKRALAKSAKSAKEPVRA